MPAILPTFLKVIDPTSHDESTLTTYINRDQISKIVLRRGEDDAVDDAYLTIGGVTYIAVDTQQIMDALFPE